MKVLSIKVPIFTTDLEKTVKDYETLLGVSMQYKFDMSSIGISVANIGDILIVGGSENVLAPLKQIRATLVVDSIEDYHSYLIGHGATILQSPESTPTGQNMIAKGKDGVVFEYVELK